MTFTLARYAVELLRNDQEWQPYHARWLTSQHFMLKNGRFVRQTLVESLSFESLWSVPGPGDKVRLAEAVDVPLEMQAYGSS